MTLAEKLRELQGDKTQDEFAEFLGINQGTLSKIYAGNRRVGIKIAKKITAKYPALSFEIAGFLLSENMPKNIEECPST